ncbi:leukocyte surface antigen CD53-like [Drosophila rhopaloa]|uniref:Tetraspanin n=1 Tax=Drosophila rhopaloa TaxID=1041015 RepID=A0ABM5J7C3_DRORH|nr:leukocyte surface antigen CD53-like [Drosophila rhopaloa]
MDNGTSVVKYLLLTVNIIVVAVTIWGIVPLLKILTNIGNIESEFPVIEIALIILGAITVFTSILGCCGATFNSIWFTKRYAAIILIHMIWQLTLFILILTNNEHFSKLLGTAIDRAWKHLDIDSFEVIQELFKCCGMNSSTDYTEKKVSIPASCYNGSPISTNLYKGCHGKSIEYLMDTTKEYQFMIIGLIEPQKISASDHFIKIRAPNHYIRIRASNHYTRIRASTHYN